MKTSFKQELLLTQLETQEYSFQELRAEIHDNIGQLLSSTKMLMSIGFMELTHIPDALKTAEKTIGKAIQDLRFLSKSLSREWVHQFNLIENLEAEQKRITAARNIHVQLITDFEKLPLEPEAQVMLFRVVQEALQNSLKRSFINNIIIQIKNTNNGFSLSIIDDGKGFDAESKQKENIGSGSMQHRVQLLNGKIVYRSNRDYETEVNIWVPCRQ